MSSPKSVATRNPRRSSSSARTSIPGTSGRARSIKASGLLPRRTIRFILFSGEEQGTIGSWAYVHDHRAEMDKYRAMVVYDTGIGRVTGYSLGGRRDTEAAIREILMPFSGWYVDNLTFDATFGTDNLDFLLEG